MIRYFLSLGFLILLCVSCKQSGDQQNMKMISVSIPPQQYFVERIAGSEWKVFILVQAGMGPETFEPSPGDFEKVSKSTFYFASGFLDFENQLVKKLKSRKNGPQLVDLSEGIDLISDHDHGILDENEAGHQHKQGIDPHYWMSPGEMKKAALHIEEVLSSRDTVNRQLYKRNLNALLADIDTLDNALVGMFKDLKTRKFVLFHPSLSYLARDYQLEQLSLEQGGKQPSTRHMGLLVDETRTAGIHTVFLQSQFDIHNMETLAKETGGKVESIDPLSADWLNNMYLIAGKLKEAMNGN